MVSTKGKKKRFCYFGFGIKLVDIIVIPILIQKCASNTVASKSKYKVFLH